MPDDWKLQVMKYLNAADMAAIRAVSSANGLHPEQASTLLKDLRVAADRYRQVVTTTAIVLDGLADEESMDASVEEGLAEVPPDLRDPGDETS